MTDNQWYYAKDGEERGPVGSQQLRELAQRGEVEAADLVWCEAMTDWAEAGRVKLLKGLFPPAEHLQPPLVQADDPSLATREAAKRVPRLPRLHLARDFASTARRWGLPLLLLGIVLAILARGFDSLGNRNVARLQARSAAAEDRFNDHWESERLALDDRIESLREREDRTAADDERLDILLERLEEMQQQRDTARREAERGAWRNLKIAARDAERNNAMWGYWRELLFVLGSVSLTLGLLAVGFTSQGPERLICLIMLAIITFSLYVGGFAWLGSFAGALR